LNLVVIVFKTSSTAFLLFQAISLRVDIIVFLSHLIPLSIIHFATFSGAFSHSCISLFVTESNLAGLSIQESCNDAGSFLVNALYHLPIHFNTHQVTHQVNAQTHAQVAISQTVTSDHFSKIGCNAQKPPQTTAHHLTNHIHLIAFHKGIVAIATSGITLPTLKAVDSLNSFLFCDSIDLTSSQNQAFHKVAISKTFHPYFKSVSKFQEAKSIAHSQAFCQNGLLSGVSCFLNSIRFFNASSVVSQSCCIFNKALHSSLDISDLPHIKSFLLCLIRLKAVWSSRLSCFILSNADCSSLNRFIGLDSEADTLGNI